MFFDVLAILAFLSQEFYHLLGVEGLRNVYEDYVHSCQAMQGKWVPATRAWRVLRLRMEERSPIWRVVASILNKQSRTADKVRSSSLGIGRGAKNSSP
jgi:hypothetical protein